eukprot:3803879-Rhodomonas_salina.1
MQLNQRNSPSTHSSSRPCPDSSIKPPSVPHAKENTRWQRPRFDQTSSQELAHAGSKLWPHTLRSDHAGSTFWADQEVLVDEGEVKVVVPCAQTLVVDQIHAVQLDDAHGLRRQVHHAVDRRVQLDHGVLRRALISHALVRAAPRFCSPQSSARWAAPHAWSASRAGHSKH